MAVSPSAPDIVEQSGITSAEASVSSHADLQQQQQQQPSVMQTDTSTTAVNDDTATVTDTTNANADDEKVPGSLWIRAKTGPLKGQVSETSTFARDRLYCSMCDACAYV